MKKLFFSFIWIIFATTLAFAQNNDPDVFDATPQRPTFTSDTSTTAPGTLEMELGTVISEDTFVIPITFKYTPPATKGLFHKTEFSVSFDTIAGIESNNKRTTKTGNLISFAIRRPVFEIKNFSIAFAPQASFFLRDQKGARLGATVFTAYAFGLNSVVTNLTFSNATSSSASNPAQKYDLAIDVGRTLGNSGAKSKTSIFTGILIEKAKKQDSIVSLLQGINYRVKPNLVLDLSLRQVGFRTGNIDYQLLTGLTVNFGRLFK
ncbi:MAG: hypothetical protein WAQ98_15940 [Blastocatellia bacterium]